MWRPCWIGPVRKGQQDVEPPSAISKNQTSDRVTKQHNVVCHGPNARKDLVRWDGARRSEADFCTSESFRSGLCTERAGPIPTTSIEAARDNYIVLLSVTRSEVCSSISRMVAQHLASPLRTGPNQQGRHIRKVCGTAGDRRSCALRPVPWKFSPLGRPHPWWSSNFCICVGLTSALCVTVPVFGELIVCSCRRRYTARWLRLVLQPCRISAERLEAGQQKQMDSTHLTSFAQRS